MIDTAGTGSTAGANAVIRGATAVREGHRLGGPGGATGEEDDGIVRRRIGVGPFAGELRAVGGEQGLGARGRGRCPLPAATAS
jgi:hypothetical protein